MSPSNSSISTTDIHLSGRRQMTGCTFLGARVVKCLFVYTFVSLRLDHLLAFLHVKHLRKVVGFIMGRFPFFVKVDQEKNLCESFAQVQIDEKLATLV